MFCSVCWNLSWNYRIQQKATAAKIRGAAFAGGLVAWQIFLVDDSLKHNVALREAASEIDDTRLHETLRKVRLSELFEQLLLGVHNLLAERRTRQR